MAADADSEIRVRRSELLDNELDKFMSHVNTSNSRAKASSWF